MQTLAPIFLLWPIRSTQNKINVEQKIHLLQRETSNKGAITKPPGTSGGRISTQFGIEDLPPKMYLPVSIYSINLAQKLKGFNQSSERSEYIASQRKETESDSRKAEKRTQPNQAFSRGCRRDKKNQFAIFPDGFNPHDELED